MHLTQSATSSSSFGAMTSHVGSVTSSSSQADHTQRVFTHTAPTFASHGVNSSSSQTSSAEGTRERNYFLTHNAEGVQQVFNQTFLPAKRKKEKQKTHPYEFTRRIQTRAASRAAAAAQSAASASNVASSPLSQTVRAPTTPQSLATGASATSNPSSSQGIAQNVRASASSRTSSSPFQIVTTLASVPTQDLTTETFAASNPSSSLAITQSTGPTTSSIASLSTFQSVATLGAPITTQLLTTTGSVTSNSSSSQTLAQSVAPSAASMASSSSSETVIASSVTITQPPVIETSVGSVLSQTVAQSAAAASATSMGSPALILSHVVQTASTLLTQSDRYWVNLGRVFLNLASQSESDVDFIEKNPIVFTHYCAAFFKPFLNFGSSAISSVTPISTTIIFLQALAIEYASPNREHSLLARLEYRLNQFSLDPPIIPISKGPSTIILSHIHRTAYTLLQFDPNGLGKLYSECANKSKGDADFILKHPDIFMVYCNAFLTQPLPSNARLPAFPTSQDVTTPSVSVSSSSGSSSSSATPSVTTFTMASHSSTHVPSEGGLRQMLP